MSQKSMNNYLPTRLMSILMLLLFLVASFAEAETETAVEVEDVPIADNTTATLKSFVDLKKDLQRDIKALNKQLRAAQTDAKKSGFKQQLEQRDADLQATIRNFEDIAAGVDISSLRQEEEQAFDFQQEILGLLRPALDEMKAMTAHVRQKSELKEKIAYFGQRLPIIEQALANAEQLWKGSKDKALVKSLKETAAGWEKQRAFTQSELQAAQLQLDKLVASETSISEASQSYLKSFFRSGDCISQARC